MAGLFGKLQENHLVLEAVCFTVIFVAMVLLLYRTVWPNFGNKSVAIGFMTAVGSLIILAYAIFVELKASTETSQAISYVAFHSNSSLPVKYSVPPRYSTNETAGLPTGTIAFINPNRSDFFKLSTELTLINIAMLITGDFRDWKKEEVRTAGITNISYRRPSDKEKRETVLSFEKVVHQLRLEHSKVSFDNYPEDWPSDFDAIYPEGVKVTTTNNSIILSHSLFQLSISVESSNSCYSVDGSGSIGSGRKYFITPLSVFVDRTRKPKLNGNKLEKEIVGLMNELNDLIIKSLNVDPLEIPRNNTII